MAILDELPLSLPIAVSTDPDGRSWLHSTFSPPLVCGLDRVEVPRTRMEFMAAQRRILRTVFDPFLVRRILRSAFLAVQLFEDDGVELYLSDAEVITERDHFTEDDLRALAPPLEAVALGVLAEIGRHPHPPWKRAVLDAWEPVAAALGAEFERDLMRLSVQRGVLKVQVFVVLDPAELATCIRIPLAHPSSVTLQALDADARLLAFDSRADLEENGLLVRRGGLIASADHLGQLIDVAVALADDLVKTAGPYR